MRFNLPMKNVLRKWSQQRRMSVNIDGYGAHTFKGAIAAPFLVKHGLAANTLDSYKWTTDGSADKVLVDACGIAIKTHCSILHNMVRWQLLFWIGQWSMVHLSTVIGSSLWAPRDCVMVRLARCKILCWTSIRRESLCGSSLASSCCVVRPMAPPIQTADCGQRTVQADMSPSIQLRRSS